jgi:hypothetical protein
MLALAVVPSTADVRTLETRAHTTHVSAVRTKEPSHIEGV